ncbi:PTS system mannose/fructose/sorbose family transporter subunit IID [Yersinia intermedia]|uniref:PTS system mannose/fructose/sorbose family transporter subunit IID n=1 Tax=Yersinia intermedia TaxID=631 RepID=UPI000B632DE6|nr:PTS system mannose/fructose/sorbose family transporter subunit IID [Yersinia intermedia]MCW8114169.1 PTS system mannose/fructose/sorbose family transporter subunit IID [Yersinia intermedia]MDA5518939.1 PTS system mannose/fructose/sorbose family transporter subunit IID [Yersinia intermedia]OWF86794.1 PTS mannose transporter subunit IID [Yersinia intermedia]
MTDIQTKDTGAYSDSKEEKKMFRQLFFRQFQLLGSMNFTRMEGLSYGWTLAPMLRKIYPDPHRYQESLKRNSQFFNTNQHLAPFIMGLTLSMEKENANNATFDTASINGIKVALMGPFAGVGDSFFYGVLRIIATGIAIGLASQGNPLGPLLFLLVYNIPSYLVRYYGGIMGYRLGSKYIAEATQSGLLKCITKASSIMGLMMVGAMSASMVKFSTTYQTTIAGQPFVLQEILDKICVGLIPLLLVLGCLRMLNKKVSPNRVLILLIVLGFAAAGVGLI